MHRTTLLHDGWQLAAGRWLAPPGKLGTFSLEWLPARVPGHVHLDLQRNGVIPDPFRALHELGVQWVDEEDWVYRTTFPFTPDPALPRRVLRFEGLDTVATVFLNGAEVARHDDMFVPLELDVTELLAPVNELRVELASAARVGRERRAAYFAREGLPPTTLRFDEQAFVRKAQYMFGWDWGPRLVSAGVFRPVALVEHAGRLTDVRWRQRHLDAGGGGDVELTIESARDEAGEPLEALHFLEGREAPLRDGEPALVERPERWFPAGLGPQRLHRLESFLVPAGTAATREAAERSARDRRTSRIGFRTVELRQEPDFAGASFELAVNDRPVWCVGANWIPDHSFPSAIEPRRLRAQLRRARSMNMNMLRVWGGGLHESDAFYDACDELGLLVWQDFTYACSYYPDDEAALEAAGREARAAVRRLRGHPSLALWCGNNENQVMFQDKWEDPERHPPRLYGAAIYDRVLPELVAAEDGERPYVPGSPFGGERINAGGTGDQHYWDVWHGRGDWTFYSESKARFCSEFGFAAAPGHAALRRMFAGGDPDPLRLPVDDRVAHWHDKTAKALETFRGMVELHYPAAKDLEEWAYLSQLNQRDALRHGIEHWRRSELCRGTLVWQLNDCWPVQSWAVVDVQGEEKCAGLELRRLYAPALASLERAGGTMRLWVQLDNALEPVRGTARLEARSTLDGTILASWEAEVALEPGDRQVVFEVEAGALEPATTIVFASFLGTRTFRLVAEPKDARLPEATIAARREGERLIVRTDAPVVDLFLWDSGGGLAPGENWLTLPEAGEVALPATGALRGTLCARSLKGRHRVVAG
jgi:beta-mannosidase